MTPKRKRWWLALELIGTLLFWLLPNGARANTAVAHVYYAAYNGLRLPNLKSPRSFNEKLIGLKLSEEARAPLRRLMTDKELVKGHVEKIIGPGHVVPTLAVLRTKAEVDSFVFPLPCVVKPTHSSQEVMHFDRQQPDAAERRTLKYWLWKSYFAANREPNYAGLEHKLIVEPIIGGAFGAIEDVKVLCFHGRPKLIQVDHNRYSGHKRDYFDIRGRLLPIAMRKAPAGLAFPYPDKLAPLLDYAARLSAGHSFLRVDFYIVGDDILVGELTSFPTNCTVPFKPDAADRAIARLFDEPDLDVGPSLFAGAQA